MAIWSTDKGLGKKCESDLILTNNPYHSIITDINVRMVMMMNLETMMEKRMEREMKVVLMMEMIMWIRMKMGMTNNENIGHDGDVGCEYKREAGDDKTFLKHYVVVLCNFKGHKIQPRSFAYH